MTELVPTCVSQIEAGGELIVTQLFYDVDIFFKFVKDCRASGITVPILPGVSLFRIPAS